MKSNNRYFSEYKRLISCVDVEESVKHQIIKNCARYSTFNKMKNGKFRIIAVIKEKTSNTF